MVSQIKAKWDLEMARSSRNPPARDVNATYNADSLSSIKAVRLNTTSKVKREGGALLEDGWSSDKLNGAQY
jgi:hypothetical protein